MGRRVYAYAEPHPADRESVTQLYVRAAPPAQPAPTPSTTHMVQRVTVGVRANALGIGFLASCTVFGVLVGIVIALRGSAATASPMPRPAPAAPMIVEPIAEPAPRAPSRPVVAPMSEPIAAPIAAPAPAAVAAPIAAPVSVSVSVPVSVPAAAAAAPRHRNADAPAAAAVAPVTAAATGTLRISSKPPCAIAIDDRPTGLTTPQAAIALAPGHHEVTLTNADQGIQLTADVDITAARTTPLIEDFTQ
jgi:hypothetical protein